jgi:hypothetical protein
VLLSFNAWLAIAKGESESSAVGRERPPYMADVDEKKSCELWQKDFRCFGNVHRASYSIILGSNPSRRAKVGMRCCALLFPRSRRCFERKAPPKVVGPHKERRDGSQQRSIVDIGVAISVMYSLMIPDCMQASKAMT